MNETVNTDVRCHNFNALETIQHHSYFKSDSTNLFKSRLDKFWKSYDFVYDSKAKPFSNGSQK